MVYKGYMHSINGVICFYLDFFTVSFLGSFFFIGLYLLFILFLLNFNSILFLIFFLFLFNLLAAAAAVWKPERIQSDPSMHKSLSLIFQIKLIISEKSEFFHFCFKHNNLKMKLKRSKFLSFNQLLFI